MANAMKYQVERKTTSTDAVPAGLQGTLYWYDTGATQNGEMVYYDNTTSSYAYWFDGAEWLISAVADVGGTPTDYFKFDSGSEYTGQGAWSGTVAVGEYTIADAWYRAETTAFESFRNFSGNVEERDCFRGYLPQNEFGDPTTSNVWMFTSGGSGEFDIERLTGDNASWCSLRSDAGIESIWSTRKDAMEFAGMIMAWLKENDNLKGTDNIQWCRLADIPPQPELYVSKGKISKMYWRMDVELELIYKTENVFA